ncbi:MAG TPA: transcriptional regulator [Azospirillaceae bacterium]|nr:transcriptional regulator [Azospirillaceae bacterium]
MRKSDFEGLKQAMNEAIAYAGGEPGGSVTHQVTVATVDVRALRTRLGMSRPAFATAFNLDARAVQEWEQGRRQPDRGTRNYLQLIEHNPEYVRKALEKHTPPDRAAE